MSLYKNNCIILTLLFFFILAFISQCGHKTEIENYRQCSKICFSSDNSESLFVIREYRDRGNDYLLGVHPDTLRTYILKASQIRCDEMSFIEMHKKYGSTNYVKMLTYAEKNSGPLQNSGITRFSKAETGVYLTADLCPSKFPLDRKLFTAIIEEYSKTGKPVPIGLAVTGLWMEKHTEEIIWLKSLEKKSLLTITWINHSYNHYYNKKLPLENNFLLRDGTDIQMEVLNTEKKMLELGLTPSVFFRFPGLVSNKNLFLKITGYGLIPVGSDAWLAKNQMPKKGSIILVHANGNEPAGISIFIKLIQNKKKNIINKTWLLNDLRESASQL